MTDFAKIAFAKAGRKPAGTVVILVGEGLALGPQAKALKLDALIRRAGATAEFTGKAKTTLDLLAPADSPLDRLILVGTGTGDEIADGKGADNGGAEGNGWVNLGGLAMGALGKAKAATVLFERPDGKKPGRGPAADFALGMKLRAYAFDNYKIEKEGEPKKKPATITISVADLADAQAAWVARGALADAVAYTEERFKPKFIIDLATLTGAIIVALGHLNAGMFATDDALAASLSAAGEATGERVWRMPLAKEYDKQIDSRFADVKNTGGRDAGAVTAAQFIKRFVRSTPWVHLDIAGTAMGSPQTDTNRSWASGWGVRLLDRLVADRYEG
jgi:leucyl aminopeptidase